MRVALLSLLLLISLPGAHAAPPRPSFVKDPDLFMAFRSNAAHFWAWAATTLPYAFQADPALARMGTVLGDAHLLNFADIYLSGKQPQISCNDLDDAGTGPLLGDLVRLYVSAQVSKLPGIRGELVTAYVRGLAGAGPQTVPDDVRSVLALTDTQVAAERREFVLKRVITGPGNTIRFNLNEAGLSTIDSAPREAQTVYWEMASSFTHQLQGFRLLDVGFKTKTSGGSRGMKRFWFLVADRGTGELRIFEFKELSDPAVGMFAPQAAPAERLARARQIFWNDDRGDFQYGVAAQGSHAFLKRPRYRNRIDPEDIAPAAARELLIFDAAVLGRIHAASASREYLDAFLSRRPRTELLLEQLAQAYLAQLVGSNTQPFSGEGEDDDS